MSKLRLSHRAIVALKCHDRRQYQLAIEASLHPSVLSRMVAGYGNIKPADPRVKRLGRVLGLTMRQMISKPRP